MATLVLVIERSDTIYEYLCDALRPHGVLVQQARTSSEIASVLIQWRPAAIVVDAALSPEDFHRIVSQEMHSIPVLRCATRSRDESRDTTPLLDLVNAILLLSTS